MSTPARKLPVALPMVLCILLAVPACMTPSQQKIADLKMLTRQHNSDVRWGRYDTAAGNYLAPGGQLFMKRVELVEGELVMADQEVQTIDMKDNDTAVCSVVLSWYTQREPVIRTTMLEQIWVYQGGNWLIKSERRMRGDRFPLVPEEVKPEDVPGTEGDAKDATPKDPAPAAAAPAAN